MLPDGRHKLVVGERVEHKIDTSSISPLHDHLLESCVPGVANVFCFELQNKCSSQWVANMAIFNGKVSITFDNERYLIIHRIMKLSI